MLPEDLIINANFTLSPSFSPVDDNSCFAVTTLNDDFPTLEFSSFVYTAISPETTFPLIE